MKKQSKFVRLLCVFVPVLLFAILLLTAISPLWEDDNKVSASAATQSNNFNFTFNSGAIVGTLMSSATLSYYTPAGVSTSRKGDVNMTNGFLIFSNVSYNDSFDLKLSVSFLAGISIHSVSFSNADVGGASVSFSGATITVSNMDKWASSSNTVNISVICSGEVVPSWHSAGIQFASDDYFVSHYIDSASLQYSKSSEASTPSVLTFVEGDSGVLSASPGFIYLNLPTTITVRTVYGVSLKSVDTVVGTGGINGSDHGGIIATLSPVQGEPRTYRITLSIDPSNISIMFLYLIPSFEGAPDIDGAYEDGYNDGYDAGFEAGSGSGYDDGFDLGYNSGYSQGFADGQDTDWGDLNVVSLYLQPVSTFLGTPLFGTFSIGNAFSVVLVVLLASIFIKMFAGG